MSGKLTGKAALITGASRGIGKGVATVYLREGARVFLCARGDKALRDTAEELGRIGPEVGYFASDVGDPLQARFAGRLS